MGRPLRPVADGLVFRGNYRDRFFYDDGSDNASRVEELLAEIDAERRK